MVQIVTRATRRQYLRPPPGGPFALNLDSPLARGLVGWWPLNHQGRTAYNMAAAQPGGRYDLTLTGTLAQREGPDGGLAHTCSATQHFQGSPTPAAVMPLTLGCWFNPNTVTDNYALLFLKQSTGHDGFGLLADGTDADLIKAMYIGSRNIFSGPSGRAFVAQRWQHALAVFRTTASRTAGINGVLGAEETTALPAHGTIDTTALGNDASSGSYASNFAGLLGDCCVWSRALNEADAMRLYDPATRWELYYPLGRKTYSFPGGAAAGGTFKAAWAVRRHQVIGGGII